MRGFFVLGWQWKMVVFLLQVKQDFLTMLKEQEEEAITEDSQWKKVKGSFSNDPRYKVVDSSSKREEFFMEYVQSLKGMAQVSTPPLPSPSPPHSSPPFHPPFSPPFPPPSPSPGTRP